MNDLTKKDITTVLYHLVQQCEGAQMAGKNDGVLHNFAWCIKDKIRDLAHEIEDSKVLDDE